MSKKPRRRPAIEAIEQRTGKSLRELAEHYAAKGYSRRMTAQELGVPVPTFYVACRAVCPDVEWPGRNEGLRRQEVYREMVESARQRFKDQGRAILVEHDGELVSLTEAARARGISPRTVYGRYRSGRRGRRLWSKPHPTKGKPNAHYNVGLTLAEWEMVAAYAKERSVVAASSKFGLPQGAINAILAGEWERVA